jgi:signal transduction histidine kinase
MKLPAASWAHLHRPKRLTTVVMMLIIWAGTVGGLFAAITTDIAARNSLRSRATTIAATISLDDLNSLENNESDLDKQEYRDLKASMQRIISENQDLRFIRVVGMKNNRPFFYLDSENPYTRDYVAPGYPYPDADQTFRTAFNGEPVVDGPHSDQWGVWLSAYAPIIDPGSNNIYAMVAIHTPALNYYGQLFIYTLVPLLLTAIPLVGLMRDRKLETKEREIAGLKNQFVSIASHELRSPITGMLWAIQSLLKSEENLTKEQQSLLNDMYNSTSSSLATVNEILDLSVFERGQAASLQRETVDMLAVIAEVTKTLKLGAQEKNIEIVRTGNWPERAYVSGDVAALKRSLMNIMSNAIKYSPEDSKVELLYNYKALHHYFGVRDHGIGIPKEEQPKVLGGYYRASNAVRLQANGTGLGLWITRLVIEEHGGSVRLKSTLNKGTTITVSLPAYHQIIPKVEESNANT